MDYTLKIEVCNDWELCLKKTQAWNHLSENHYNPNVFLTLNWLKLWWEVYSAKNDIMHIVYIWENEDVIAIFPLYLQQGKLFRFIGTGEAEADEVCSEYLDILVKNNEIELVRELIGDYCQRLLVNNNSFEFNNILANSNIINVFRDSKINALSMCELVGVRYFLTLPKSYSIFESSCSKAFISQSKRKMRKFNKLNGEVIEVNNQDDLLIMFDKLTELHNLRWTRKGMPGVFSSKKFTMFHLEFAKIMLEKGCLSMKALKISNAIVGVIYSFSYKKNKAFYQMGIDSTIKHNVSPGTLLHLLEIESSIARSDYLYDFMKGNESTSYKNSFTNQQTAMFNILVVSKNINGYYSYFQWLIISILKKIKGIKK